MAISKWCSKCSTDNSTTNSHCSKCSASLPHGKRRERLKVNGKWKTRVFTLDSVDVPLDYKISWKSYYASARLLKKSHGNDLQIYRTYLEDNDWFSTEGIISILADAKDSGKAPASVKHIFSTIRRVHNWHIELHSHPTGSNPCKPIKLPKVDNTITNPLSKEDSYALLEYLQDHKNRQMAIIVSLAILTGRRQGELLKLRREDIQNGYMICRNTKNGKTLKFPLSSRAEILIDGITGRNQWNTHSEGPLCVHGPFPFLFWS